MIHEHDWLIVHSNVRYRDEYANELVIDFYRCSCGAGGRVVTPKAVFDQGMMTLGIEEMNMIDEMLADWQLFQAKYPHYPNKDYLWQRWIRT